MKKGFTLMELLAVIIVLGVVSIITVNVVTNNIETTKKKTFEVNAIGLLESAKEYVTKEMENNDFPEEGIEAKNLNMKNNPFISGIVRRNEQDQIILENVTDGKYCVNGVRSNLEITEGSCEIEDDTAPTLKIKELKTKRTSAQIMIKTQDNGSGISYYEYCVNEKCEKVEKNGSKEIIKEVITINNLEPNKEYVVKVKVVNGKELEEVKEVKIKTKEIEEPTFKISSSTHATTKELIITYPSVEEGYVKGYELYRGETPDKKEVTGLEERLQITETMKVVAYIEKDNQIIVSNEIEIVGIDLDAPKVNVLVPDIDNWTKTKIVTIEATDEGVGLALRPYSYDGGKTWVKENKKEYTTATQLDIKVRDRLGNISNEFTLNEGSCFENGKNLCYINKVDGVAPDVEIKVIEGERINEYYISENIKINIIISEKYLYNNDKKNGGSGIEYENLKITKNGNNIGYKMVSKKQYEAIYEVVLKENGIVTDDIKVEISDILGNNSTKNLILKIERFQPIISSIVSPILGLKPNVDYLLSNNIKSEFGPLGGNVVCTPDNNKSFGNQDINVICTATGVNKLSSSTSYTVKHEYAARYVYKRCSYQSCGSEYCCQWSWDGGCHMTGGNCTPTQYCVRDGCRDCDTKYYDCPYYDCPSGGTLSGTVCRY